MWFMCQVWDSRDIFIVKDEGVFDVALLCVDVGHPDHLHPGTEVAPRRHVVVHLHGAAFLGQSADSLLRLQTDVGVIRHRGKRLNLTHQRNRS